MDEDGPGTQPLPALNRSSGPELWLCFYGGFHTAVGLLWVIFVAAA